MHLPDRYIIYANCRYILPALSCEKTIQLSSLAFQGLRHHRLYNLYAILHTGNNSSARVSAYTAGIFKFRISSASSSE